MSSADSQPTTVIQPTTSTRLATNSRPPCAVHVSKLFYSQDGTRILNGINLYVPKSSIYCLIGPSGCGKTTLLRCVIGILKSKSGLIKVFGKSPGSGSSEVPGPQVGYMPQETALYQDMTCYEVMYYFGSLTSCPLEQIKPRRKFLLSLLDMIDLKHRKIATLSGGQVRRLSFAVALIHSPALLILDEPTAGVDPLLRHNIWKHLRTLTQQEEITVIITTHYVEEARQADIIALMRDGNILTEEPPDELLKRNQAKTIEDAFLKICKLISSQRKDYDNPCFDSSENVREIEEKEESHSSSFDNNHNIDQAKSEQKPHSSGEKPDETVVQVQAKTNITSSNSYEEPIYFCPAIKCKNKVKRYFEVMRALNYKNFLRNLRHLEVILFQFFMPVVIIIFFCYCIGPQPFHIRMAVVNEECQLNESIINDTELKEPDQECLGDFGRRFLSKIDPYLIRQQHFADISSAIKQVKRGSIWGVIHIKSNFSEALEKRISFAITDDEFDVETENSTVEQSIIRIYADLTDKVITISIQRTLDDAFLQFTKDTLRDEGYNQKLATPPIVLAKPVYGRDEKQKGYTEFMAPGILINISFVMASGLTALIFLMERRDGLFERHLVCGVGPSQILIAHLIIRLGTMIIASVIVLALTLYWLDLFSTKGSIFWMFLILVGQNCAGMSFGMLVSAVCKQENAAAFLVASTVIANLTLCGHIWPLEAQPYFIRWVSYLMPSAMPTEALRGLMNKDWSIDHMVVQWGVFATVAWFLIFSVASMKLFRFIK